MMRCTQCRGNGFLQAGNRMTPGGLTDGLTFTASKQLPETTCPTCLGTGIQTGAGT